MKIVAYRSESPAYINLAVQSRYFYGAFSKFKRVITGTKVLQISYSLGFNPIVLIQKCASNLF